MYNKKKSKRNENKCFLSLWMTLDTADSSITNPYLCPFSSLCRKYGGKKISSTKFWVMGIFTPAINFSDSFGNFEPFHKEISILLTKIDFFAIRVLSFPYLKLKFNEKLAYTLEFTTHSFKTLKWSTEYFPKAKWSIAPSSYLLLRTCRCVQEYESW